MLLIKKIKLKITEDCKEYLSFASEQCRLLYNFSLVNKIKYYKKYNKSLSIYEQKKNLPILKEKYPEYKNVYNKCLSAVLFRLNDSYQRFFSKQNKYPKFKRKGVFISQEYPGMYIKRINQYNFILPVGGRKTKNFNIKTTEKIPKKYSTVTIVKQKDQYFACFIVTISEKDFIDNKEIVAFDLGIKTLAVGYSTKRSFIEIPKFSHYTRHLDKLRSKRDLCKRGSIKWKKADKLFQKRLLKYKNRANDYLHKSSHWITNRSESTIIVGKLNLNSMLKEKQPWFNRVIQNEWRVKRFVQMLNYKCKKFGKKFVEINERCTTQECSQCGKKQKLSLKDRVYSCNCGLTLGRDKNSAINILKKYCTASAIEEKSSIRFTSVNNLSTDRFVYT